MRDLCLKVSGLPATANDSVQGDALPERANVAMTPHKEEMDTALGRRVRDAVRGWHSDLPWYVQYITPRKSLTSLVRRVVSAVRTLDA